MPRESSHIHGDLGDYHAPDIPGTTKITWTPWNSRESFHSREFNGMQPPPHRRQSEEYHHHSLTVLLSKQHRNVTSAAIFHLFGIIYSSGYCCLRRQGEGYHYHALTVYC